MTEQDPQDKLNAILASREKIIPMLKTERLIQRPTVDQYLANTNLAFEVAAADLDEMLAEYAATSHSIFESLRAHPEDCLINSPETKKVQAAVLTDNPEELYFMGIVPQEVALEKRSRWRPFSKKPETKIFCNSITTCKAPVSQLENMSNYFDSKFFNWEYVMGASYWKKNREIILDNYPDYYSDLVILMFDGQGKITEAVWQKSPQHSIYRCKLLPKSFKVSFANPHYPYGRRLVINDYERYYKYTLSLTDMKLHQEPVEKHPYSIDEEIAGLLSRLPFSHYNLITNKFISKSDITARMAGG